MENNQRSAVDLYQIAQEQLRFLFRHKRICKAAGCWDCCRYEMVTNQLMRPFYTIEFPEHKTKRS